MQYNTPTLGLYFFADDFIEFLSNLGPSCRRIPCHCVSLHIKAAMLNAFDFEEIGSGSVITL